MILFVLNMFTLNFYLKKQEKISDKNSEAVLRFLI